MSIVAFVIAIVAAADAKQRLGEFVSREEPVLTEREMKVSIEMHYLGIEWPPNGFVSMELLRAGAWSLSIYLLILEYETHSTIETLLYVWWILCFVLSMLSSNLISRLDHDDTFLTYAELLASPLCCACLLLSVGFEEHFEGYEDVTLRRESKTKKKASSSSSYGSTLL